MKRVRIQFSTTIYYDQYHDVSDEEYEILKEYEGQDIPDIVQFEDCKTGEKLCKTCEAHDIISELIEYDSVYYDNEFENFEMEDA